MLDRPVHQPLSALDLARRVEAGELTPEAVVEQCAAAIAAREDEVGAFTISISRRRGNSRAPTRRACAHCRCAGSRSA